MDKSKMNLHDKKALPEEQLEEIVDQEEIKAKEESKDIENKEEKKVDEEEEKIVEVKQQKMQVVKYQRRHREKVQNNKDFQMQKNYYEAEKNFNVISNFLKESNVQSLSLSKGDKFQMLHKFLVEETQNQCDDMSIIRVSKRLSKFLDDIIEKVKSCIQISDKRKKCQLKVESTFISRISYNPFKFENIFRVNKKFEKLENISEIMTAIYLHPCYLIKIIQADLMSDDDVFRILTQVYENESQIRTGYLVQYALAAFERDLNNVSRKAKSVENIDLKRLPSKKIIEYEHEVEKKKLQDKKLKKKAKRKAKKENTNLSENNSDSEEEHNQEEERPLCLFYRIVQWMLLRDPSTKNFIYLIAIYIINKVVTIKTQPDTDDQHYMAFDMYFQSEPSKKIAESNERQVQIYLQKRIDDIKQMVWELVDRFNNPPLDIDDSGSRRFDMKIFDGKDELDCSSKDLQVKLYTPMLSEEIRFFLIESFDRLKN